MPPWLARPRIIAVVVAGAELVLGVFALTISAPQDTARELERAQVTLAAARATVTSHDAVMREQGERLLGAARASRSAGRERWTAGAEQ